MHPAANVFIVPILSLPVALALLSSTAAAQPHAAVLLCDDDASCGADLA